MHFRKNTMSLSSFSSPASGFLLFAALLTVLFLFHGERARADEAAPPENTINISFRPEQRSMTGTARIVLPPDTPLTLHCGQLDVSGALLEKTGQTPLALRPSAANTLTVPATDAVQTLYVSWSLIVPQHGAGDNLISPAGITLAGLWHPLPDRDMIYRLEALLPDNFTAVSEGETLTYCKDDSDGNYFSSTFAHPVRSIHFVAGPYTVKHRETAGGVKLAAFFFQKDLDLAAEYLDKTAAYITRYEELIGPYPYDRYSIVENRLPTGYGMPTFTLLGQAVVRLPFITDTSLGHEVLHSWFGNSVRLPETGGNWVEGLTTYLADHLYAEDAGEGADYRKNQLIRYASYVHADNTMPLEQFANASDSQPMARQVRAIGYDKSSMVFHMLLRRLGEESFFAGLRQFYLAHRHDRAGWEDLEKSFSAVAGEDLAPFFAQWLTRSDIPALAPDPYAIDVSQIEGRSVITFTLRQQTDEPYDLDVPVAVKTRSGQSMHTVRVSGESDEVQITVDDIPSAMTIDPSYDLMRALTAMETPPTWSRFMGAGNKTAVLPPAEKSAIYAPLLPVLEEMSCELVAVDELESPELAQGSFLFLGPSSKSLGLFADPGHAAEGFTLDMRANPLEPGQVMGLVTSSSADQSAAVAGKLRHYGKYGYLYFVDGRIGEQSTAPTAAGIEVELFPGPEGFLVPDIRSFDDIIAELGQSRVVYFGEIHTDMGTHIAQLQVIQALHQENPALAIGMEMFPRSVQKALDRYIDGITTEIEFIKESNYFTVWGYDYRLYREIIEYARLHRIPVIGLNIDKAIVSHVSREGSPDGLQDDFLDDLPIERKLDLPGYRERLSRAFSSHNQNNANGMLLGGFIQAQSIWDEAMAETIAGFLRANPEKRMVVIAGNGHVYKDTAIPPRVARRIDVPQTVLSSISHNNTGRETGYLVDYLLYTRALELPPPAKVGVVLEMQKVEETPDRTRLRVIQISPHGKAGEAGMVKNDVILAVDGQGVETIDDLKIILLDRKPGDTVKIRVLRSQVLLPDKELELEVELSSPVNSGGLPATHP
ncbi:MAG TPA: PDZ domain-containing protein [Desulfobacteraceae bacterium]|nr:PDZ domain-containing protein [Desulfobacteraceae bacterium]